MKTLLFVFLHVVSMYILAQDTLSSPYPLYSHPQFIVVEHGDTVLHSYYPNMVLESLTPKGTSGNGIYKKYNEKGVLLWKQEFKGGRADGETVFFNSDGGVLAYAKFENGSFVEFTKYVSTGTFVFGVVNYESSVIGGAVGVDGQANVSKSEGRLRFFDLKIVNKDGSGFSVNHVETDVYGQFFKELDYGVYSVLPGDSDELKCFGNNKIYLDDYKMAMTGFWDIEGNPLVANVAGGLFVSLKRKTSAAAP